ncbi:MAG: dihydrodipicolinate synthase family protein [Chloroflexota bacterium]|nr:dihydrodipicolinate synthase family protein [Chloroflexota bacterium]
MRKEPMTTPQFRGLYSVMVTPFDERGTVDGPALRRVIDFNIEAGAHGIVAPVFGSEFFTLSDDERRLVIRTAAETVAHRIPYVAGVTGASPQHSAELAKYAEQCGAEAVIATAPIGQAMPFPHIEEYFRALSDVVSIPVFVQNISVGTPLSAEQLAKLVHELEHVKYVKEETLQAGHTMEAFLKLAGDVCQGVMGGSGGGYLLEEYRRGSCGTMPGPHIPDVHAAIWNALEAGDEKKARSIFNRTLPLHQRERLHGVALYKEVLHRRGIIASTYVRVPGRRTLDAVDQEELDAALAELEGLFTCHPPQSRKSTK